MRRIILVIFAIIIYPVSSFAAIDCREGVDYTLVSSAKDTLNSDEITVVEFFSYGCPGCNSLEPTIERLRDTLPEGVTFSRVPVIFSSSWGNYARAYYLAEALGIEREVSPALFKAIHEQRQNLTTESGLENFFSQFDVSPAQVSSVLTHSPLIDDKLQKGEELKSAYSVNLVPTLVVNGQYKTDTEQAGGPTRLVEVVNCLIDKAKQADSSQAGSSNE